MKLLVIEDEQDLADALAQGLRNRGCVVDIALKGKDGISLARINTYDAILLDLMLPDISGLDVCKKLREASIATPILFLTAQDATSDRITGLDAGADDYLGKPFSLDEVFARIRALVRRGNLLHEDILRLEDLHLNTRTQEVAVAGKVISLTLREYGLLEYFLRHQGSVVTREDILEHVWDRFFDSLSNVVDVHVKNLRKKLPPSYGKRIKTVWGKGYRLV